MTSRVTVTDAALEAMLARRAWRGSPVGLADAAFAAVEATEPRRVRWLAWPTRPAVLASWLPGRPSPGLTWVLVAATLLLALLASALAGGATPRGPLTKLVPTGIDAMTPESGIYDRVLADGAGTLWAVGPGHLTRFDPETGARQTWTVADDAVFSDAIVARARAGGVWLWSGSSIRHFDGKEFRRTIAAPPDSGPTYLDEAPDGSLWALSWGGALNRWDGSAWVAAPPGRPTAQAGFLLVRGADDIWVANPMDQRSGDGGPASAGISHLVSGRWVTYGPADSPILGGSIGAIAAVADGSIWVTRDPGASSIDPGIARFDGRSWTMIDGPGFPAWWLEAGADGSVWAVTGQANTLAIARYAGGRWTTYGAADGLSGTALGHVSVTPAGVFLGTDAGLFRLAGERWVPAWPNAAAGPGSVYNPGDRLLAVSTDEAWAADDRRIWHFAEGAWQGPEEPGDLAGARIRSLALAADGTLWVATDRGVATLRAGRWSTVSRQDSWTIRVGRDGTAWAGGPSTEIVGLRADGSAPPRTVTCPNGAMLMAATADGSVYVGQFAYSGTPGLARFDGRTCEKVDPLGDGLGVEVVDLAAGSSGGLVALLLRGGGSPPWTSYLARLDGGRWSVVEEQAGVDGVSGDISVSPAGQVWRAGAAPTSGIERLDDGRWIRVITGIQASGPISVAPDGSVWYGAFSGVQRFVPAPPPP
jgi:hypothetical protein